MSELAFLSASRCAPGALASPLARALAGVDPDVVRDLSLEGKVEIRGDLGLVTPGGGEELIRLSPRRGLLLVSGDPLEAIERLRGQGLRAYDVSGALAGLAVQGDQLLRRLTDLDLDELPAAGGFARIGAILLRDEGERFRVYVPQELGHYVAEVVLDVAEGLMSNGQTAGPVHPGHGAPSDRRQDRSAENGRGEGGHDRRSDQDAPADPEAGA